MPSSSTPPFSFAAAMPPRCEALFPSSAWMQAVADSGHTHLCLQNDPFFHQEMYLPEGLEHLCRLLSLFDLVQGPRSSGYLAWLSAIDRLAHDHGLSLAMEMWEPKVTWLGREALPQEWFGPERASGWVKPLCTSQPEVLAWLTSGFQTLMKAAPHFNAIVLGTNDNGALLCDESCARCSDRPETDRLGELYAHIESACRDLRDDVRIIPYDWEWAPQQYDAVFDRLSGPPLILTRLDRRAEHTPDPDRPDSSGRIYDECLASTSVGEDFLRADDTMKKRDGKVLVMPTLSGCFESFQIAHVPAVGLHLEKFDRMRNHGVTGWVDYDCGGIHRGLMTDLVAVVQQNPEDDRDAWTDRLATRRYGKAAAAPAREHWQAFDRAVSALPTCLTLNPFGSHYSGTFGIAMGLLPLHPFMPERVTEGPAAAWNRRYMHFDPHKLAHPNTVEPTLHHLRRALGFVESAGDLAADVERRAETEEQKESARIDARIAEMVFLHWRSIRNFYAWAAAHQGDVSIDLAGTIRDELEVVGRFRQRVVDPSLEFGNMTWSWERSVAMSVPEASGDLWRAVEVNRAAEWTDQPFPELAGKLWEWKIAHLERQLDEVNNRS